MSRIFIILMKEVIEECSKGVDSEVVGMGTWEKSAPRCWSAADMSIFDVLSVCCICSLE